MLVLTRKQDQAIAVCDTAGFASHLKITVLAIGRGTVKLGIEADVSVPVHRWEVWERILTDSRVGAEAEVSNCHS